MRAAIFCFLFQPHSLLCSLRKKGKAARLRGLQQQRLLLSVFAFLCYRRCAVKRVQGGSSSSVFKDKMEFCKIFSNSDLWIHFLCIDCFTGNLLSSGKPKEMDDGEGNECLGRPVNSL